MIESREQLKQTEIKDLVFTKFWEPITNEPYSEALQAFFPNGAKFNGKITTKKLVVTNPTDPIPLDSWTGSLYNKKSGIKLNIYADTNFYLTIRFLTVPLIEFFINVRSNIIQLLSSNGAPLLYTYSYDFDNNEFTCVLQAIQLNASVLDIQLTNFIQKKLVTLEEFEFREPNVTITSPTPQLDSSDLCGFLWAIKQGIITSEKIFSAESLIKNQFSYIESIEEVSYENTEFNETNLSNILKETKNGDIFVFNQNDIFHCIFVIDVKKRYYTECSATVEFNLGEFYNCKINPFDFTYRFIDLAKTSIVHKIRLYDIIPRS